MFCYNNPYLLHPFSNLLSGVYCSAFFIIILPHIPQYTLALSLLPRSTVQFDAGGVDRITPILRRLKCMSGILRCRKDMPYQFNRRPHMWTILAYRNIKIVNVTTARWHNNDLDRARKK